MQLSSSKSFPAILSLTSMAIARCKEILKNENVGNGGALRLSLRSSGCVGVAYQLDVVENKNAGDDTVTQDGVTIYVDAKAVLYLLGTEIDYKEGAMSSGFVFNNPNQTAVCGCGESFALQTSEHGLESQAG